MNLSAFEYWTDPPFAIDAIYIAEKILILWDDCKSAVPFLIYENILIGKDLLTFCEVLMWK